MSIFFGSPFSDTSANLLLLLCGVCMVALSAREASVAYVLSFVVLAVLAGRRTSVLYEIPPSVRRRRKLLDTTLGRPHQGVHAARLCGMAATDTLATVCFACVLARVARGGFPVWVVLLWTSSEWLHARYGVVTGTRRWLFGGHDGRGQSHGGGPRSGR
jgi:hypothetical protein